MKLFLSVFILSLQVWAVNCDLELQKITQAFNQRYEVSKMKNTVRLVTNHTSADEKEEFLSLQKKFISTPHDADHMNDLYAMQARARELVRAIVSRSGFEVLNPVVGPFDAVISEKSDSTGYVYRSTEVRSLLVRENPLGHITIWEHTTNPKLNPWSIVQVGITDQIRTDYVSYRPQNANRITVSTEVFLKTLLPLNCR